MQLADFYSGSGNTIQFSRDQASRFAKQIANDFNPIHNPDSKLFCVPGDLLFSVALSRFGLSNELKVRFAGMVRDDTLLLPEVPGEQFAITDADGKEFLCVERSGDNHHDADTIAALSEAYVAYSGKTFPDVLIPLMAEHNVMVNPRRPMIMYERMELHLERVDLGTDISLEPAAQELVVNGKKGSVKLNFHILCKGKRLGCGTKHMALRGLAPYDAEAVEQMVADYVGYKTNWQG